MPCYSPLKGFRARHLSKNGKRGLVFSAKDGFIDMPVEVACGQCIGCRLERSRQWAIRCVHEASLYSSNCFITLTYNNQNLPATGSLDKQAFPKFMKRLRKRFGSGVRYFHCGEYGEEFGRPHYHACLFNFEFSDKVPWRRINGNMVYTSEELSKLWPFGFSTIGEVTFESAAYVARYVMKKVTGDAAKEHYTRIDPHTGEWYEIEPEYTTMSRRPGIGKAWFDKFSSDVYPDDFVVIRGGIKCKPPRYYDSQFELLSVKEREKIARARRVRAFSLKADNTAERLKVRQMVLEARLKFLVRSID